MTTGTIVKTNKKNQMYKALKNQLFEIKDFVSVEWAHVTNITTGTQYKFRTEELDKVF